LSDGLQWPAVHEIADKIYGLATWSATFERNFSIFRFIQFKLRTSFSSESVEKLVFIKTNLKVFCGDTVGLGLEMDTDNWNYSDE
jgi:hypothetical protein